MNQERSTYTSTNNDNSSIRPRNRRLISYGDDLDSAQEDVGASSSWSQSNSRSLFPPRGISPIPGAHPSRPPLATENAGSASSTGLGQRRNDKAPISASSGLGLWDSWSSIQGIASSLLGSDAQQATKGKGGSTFNTSLFKKPSKASGPRPPTPQWGPETGSGQKYTAGSKEERQAMVQAKKREALLLADVNRFPNGNGPHKRRDSDLRASSSANSVEQDGDALVYVHKVKPEDTLAGVMIRYQCQPAVFRKVNRLWPNDNIQIREHVFLPVEACAVRGRKVDGKDPTAEVANSLSKQPEPDSSHCPSVSATNHSSPFFPIPNPNLDPEYTHEHFVTIPNIAENVEIARIPRRTLGFFPPSRRKSQTFSDLDPYSDNSPKTSLDLLSRINPTSLSNPSASPARHSRPSRLHRSGSSSYFIDRLKGPGGVGTLRGSGLPGTSSHPGPGEDSLNKIFAPHLPNVAPRESFDSVHSASSTGLENVGGVIEGWVRKVGTRIAGNVLEPAEAYRLQGRLGLRLGDLIELESSVDGEGRDGDGDGLLEQGQRHEDAGLFGPAAAAGGTATATEEALLRERFPPKGRTVDAQNFPERGR